MSFLLNLAPLRLVSFRLNIAKGISSLGDTGCTIACCNTAIHPSASKYLTRAAEIVSCLHPSRLSLSYYGGTSRSRHAETEPCSVSHLYAFRTDDKDRLDSCERTTFLLFFTGLCYLNLPTIISNLVLLAMKPPCAIAMKRRGLNTVLMLAVTAFSFIPVTICQHYSPQADAAPTVNVDALFQYTTSRNHKVISQAVDFVVSMQTAPTCTRMAASHLMNECRLLEHAPDFAKSRPEAYLDNVKTEYAAKLAVCELLSAQPSSPTPPLHCEILVPTSKACSKGGGWWHAKADVASDKQCYPDFKDYQYTQCLKSLQSTPQFWTSFSNARQNAVVMCQASRDAIERENHLETFKNLTQVLGVVTSTMQKTTEDYETLIKDHTRFSEEARESHTQLQNNIRDLQDKAVATVGVLDEKFHNFMEVSVSELITTLADSQSAELVQIHERMQDFSQDLMVESSQLARLFTGELQQYHERALHSLQTNHQAQVHSYNILSDHMGAVQNSVNQTNDIANSSLSKISSIAERLDIFESQTEHITEAFAFLSAIPGLVSLAVRGLVITLGSCFLFATLYKLNAKLASSIAGASCSAFVLYTIGVFDWLGAFSSHLSGKNSQSLFPGISSLSSAQKGAAVITVLWLSAHPVARFNSYMGTFLTAFLRRILSPIWLRHYCNEGGPGLLPGIEIPDTSSCRPYNNIFNNDDFHYSRPFATSKANLTAV